MESKTFPEPRLGNTEFVTLITLNISIQFISNAKKRKIHFVDFFFMLAKKTSFLSWQNVLIMMKVMQHHYPTK